MHPDKLLAKPVTDQIYKKLQSDVAIFCKKTGRPPSLATVLVGENAGSKIYVSKKGEACAKIGINHVDFKLPSNVGPKELFELITKLNKDEKIDGILVQSPLPKQCSEREVYDLIDPAKDVDCFSPENVGRLAQGRAIMKPCTPAGVMEILSHYNISTEGKNALVMGRSDIVGKPMAMMLTQANATVTLAHSKTKNIEELVANSDIIVVAVGKPGTLNSKMRYKNDAVIIDVGINRDAAGKISGDASFEQLPNQIKSYTPVPGGVGPMTIAMLMVNTVRAANERAGLQS